MTSSSNFAAQEAAALENAGRARQELYETAAKAGWIIDAVVHDSIVLRPGEEAEIEVRVPAE